MSEANWWEFSINPLTRGQKITNDLAEGTREINPTLEDNRRTIDYSDYLCLTNLLTAQIPASETPDERIFIVTHHLFEIVFKQMIFDLTVIAETFEQVLTVKSEDEFHFLCTSREESEELWRPAVFAANRLKYSAKTVLPVFFHFLDKSEGKDETFSGTEYFKFRKFLPPASGLQSAQFRLIQRAFAKGGLFDVRLFPSAEYRKDYEGQKNAADLIEITNKVIVRESGDKIANPQPDSEYFKATQIDFFAHQVLTRIAQFADDTTEISGVNFIPESEIETAIEAFRRILIIHRKDQEKIGEKPKDAEIFDKQAVLNFRNDLETIVENENKRRSNLQLARAASFYLHFIAPKSNFMHVLNRLIATDTALFGQHEDSFLSLHLKMAADRVREVQETARLSGAPEQPAGTGGGGVPYLINVRNNLIKFFPLFIAFQNIEDAPSFSWIE